MLSEVRVSANRSFGSSLEQREDNSAKVRLKRLRHLAPIGAMVLLTTIGACFTSPVSAQGLGWVRYSEADLSVDVPTYIFPRRESLASGARFVRPDGRANLTTKTYPPTAKSPGQFLSGLGPPSGIVYRKIGRDFFVVSSYRNDSIWYNRCNFSGYAVGCVLLNYPASEKRRWDAAATRISNSLRVR